MEALITSYGLDFKSFNDLLIKHRAIIAGSSVLSVYLDNIFVSNDIDVWIPCGKSLNEFLPIYKDLFKYFIKYGYDDEEINKQEVTNERGTYTNLPTGRASITKVIEFYNSEDKRIQFIFISMDPINFIKHTFDLSVCMTWYDPMSQIIKTFDEFYTKKMKMYINYDKEFKDLHPKNQARVEKYISRGFELIPKPLPVLKEKDERIFTKNFKVEANDVILLGDVNICDYLKESNKNIILKVSRSYYAYNRDELIRELNKFKTLTYTLTPLKQAICISSIKDFEYDDYSIYDLKLSKTKTNDNKHTFHTVKPMSVKKYESMYNENGVKDGTIKKFYSNKILKSETVYVDGKKNGNKVKYDTRGKILEEIPYINDKIHGIRKYFSDGYMIKLSSYKDDKLHGKCVLYFIGGYNINIEANYIDNKLHGNYIEYNIDGKIITKILYDNGEIKKPKSIF